MSEQVLDDTFQFHKLCITDVLIRSIWRRRAIAVKAGHCGWILSSSTLLKEQNRSLTEMRD